MVQPRRAALSGARRDWPGPDGAAAFRGLSVSPVPDEPAIAAARERLKRVGLHPFSLALGVEIERWLKRAPTTWDAFPDTGHGKMDAESCGVAAALAYPNVELRTGAQVLRLLSEPDGRRIAGVEVVIGDERVEIGAKLVVLSAGAVNSAALLLRSGDGGLANRSDAVGRHFMNHNLSAVVGIDPRWVNDSVYQKTLGVNDFYLHDEHGGPPLGNIQLLGRVTAPILKSNVRFAPEWALGPVSRHSIDWLAMSEDLPSPESRVTVHGARHSARLETQQLGRACDARQGAEGSTARGRLSVGADPCVRPPHAVAPMRHGAHRRRRRAGAARSALPRLRSPQSALWSTPPRSRPPRR